MLEKLRVRKAQCRFVSPMSSFTVCAMWVFAVGIRWNGIYFGLMHNVRAALPTPSSRAMDLLQSLIVGCSAGIIATCFNCPFDVAKSRCGV